MSKLVALSDRAYGLLARRKRGKESFSDVVLREMGTNPKPDIMQFAGVLSGGEWLKIEKRLYKERHEGRLRGFQ